MINKVYFKKEELFCFCFLYACHSIYLTFYLVNLNLDFSTRNIEDVNEENAGNWIDQEFNWKDYLDQTGDKPASERLFKHVSEKNLCQNINF